MQHWWASWFGDPEYEVDTMTVRTILQDKDYLISTIRPYLDKGLTGVPSWLVPELVSILGAGVVEAAIEESRLIDSFDGVEGYYTTLEAEIAYERGEWSEVVRLASLSQGDIAG